MTAQNATTTSIPGFTLAERRALKRLRARYQGEQDLWSSIERARLEFARWLYQTGRLRPEGRWQDSQHVPASVRG